MTEEQEKTYTTFDISRICGVYPTTVANWIDKGVLRAFFTPGGHRRVKEKDLTDFLKSHKIPVPDEPSRSAKKRILLVDDDKNVMSAMVSIIKTQKKKYETFTASDGFEAGLAVEINKPHLVILDLLLPGLDGFGVCRIIKKYNKKIKILAVTGYDTPDTKKAILEAGADDYLGKPFEIEVFMKKIESMFSKE